MTVKIVTDSVSDLPPDVAKKLNITIVPITVRFGNEVYRDGIDLTPEQFYEKMKTSKVMPVTSVPPPAAFAEVYDRLAKEADAIVVITLSGKLSATCEVARQGIELMKQKCPVKVVDSRWATMAQGFIVMKAAAAARAGASPDEVLALVQRHMHRVDIRATFDTLEYLRRGGRIGHARAFLGSMLRVNPIIGLKDGLVEPMGRTRSRARAIDRLYEFVMNYSKIEELAVGDTLCPAEADTLAERLSVKFPRERIYRSRMTPAMGTHTGPGLLLVAVLGDK